MTVIVEVTVPLAGGITGFGLKLAVAPGGRPEADSVTEELKPLIEETVTVTLVEPLAVTDSEVGLTLMLKSCCTKYTVTDLLESIVTVVGFDEPEASPPQWSNVHPLAGVAVRVTFVPLA